MNKRIIRTFTRIEAILAVALLVIAFFIKDDTTRIVCRVAAIVMLFGAVIQGKIVNNIQDDINSGKEQQD
jgi:hypothetical protein